MIHASISIICSMLCCAITALSDGGSSNLATLSPLRSAKYSFVFVCILFIEVLNQFEKPF